jgi:hypothetical protein
MVIEPDAGTLAAALYKRMQRQLPTSVRYALIDALWELAGNEIGATWEPSS